MKFIKQGQNASLFDLVKAKMAGKLWAQQKFSSRVELADQRVGPASFGEQATLSAQSLLTFCTTQPIQTRNLQDRSEALAVTMVKLIPLLQNWCLQTHS